MRLVTSDVRWYRLLLWIALLLAGLETWALTWQRGIIENQRTLIRELRDEIKAFEED